MKPNPGGQLAAENIVGRDDLVAQMWDVLEGRSIYMNDLRRVGKTMILREMNANPAPGWLTVKPLLEQDHYLTRPSAGHYTFRFPLIRRWWRFDRSL
jgi:hypothetical protein